MQPSSDTPLSAPFGRQDPSLPQVFGRYLLVQRLSRGGMGEIFLAKHGLAGFEKLAVIKKVLPHLAADNSFISRFVDEAQVAIKLSHVNIAQVFEVGRVNTEYFLALEFVDGRDMRRVLSRLGHRAERLPVDMALFISREVANGLAYAHRRVTSDGQPLNLVHCDISPPNVLVSFEGETKVIDFGIAKSVMRATSTDPKVGFGKFGYMAPEQLIRGGHVDHRTDIYAAGVVLYEALTGTRLYESGPEPNYRELARKVSRGEHPLPSDVDASLALYDDLVATALRPKPEARFQSAAELRDAIQHCLVTVNPTISTEQLGTYMRDLFADEMAANRELHERVASAHLADFQAQFHTQTISTVSFAMAQLPLPAPESTGPMTKPPPPPPIARTTGPNRVPTGPNVIVSSQTTGRHAAARFTGPSATSSQSMPAMPAMPAMSNPITGRNVAAARSSTGLKPSPAFDTLALPTGALDPVELPPSGPHAPSPPMLPPPLPAAAFGLGDLRPIDRTIDLVLDRTAMVRSHRGWKLGVSAALIVAAGVVVWSFAHHPRRDDASLPVVTAQTETKTPPPPPPPTQQVATAPTVPASGVTVEPIAVAPRPQVSPIVNPPAPPAPPAPPHDAPAHHPAIAAVANPPHADPKPAGLSREQLGQKFQQVSHEYTAYKAKFGERLEREWGQLATRTQFMGSDEESLRGIAREIDAFRAKMRD